MNLVLLIALLAAAATVTVAAGTVRAWRAGGRAVPDEVSVTLSVLPTRTAVVVLDVDGDGDVRSAALAPLVQHAVREAFLFDAVDVVEVRRRDGGLVERRRRPARPRLGARAF